jgi:hypothetical protein
MFWNKSLCFVFSFCMRYLNVSLKIRRISDIWPAGYPVKSVSGASLVDTLPRYNNNALNKYKIRHNLILFVTLLHF